MTEKSKENMPFKDEYDYVYEYEYKVPIAIE